MNYRILLGLFVLGCGGGDFHPTDDTTSTDPASDSSTPIGIQTAESPENPNSTDTTDPPANDEGVDFETPDDDPPPQMDAGLEMSPTSNPDAAPPEEMETENAPLTSPDNISIQSLAGGPQMSLVDLDCLNHRPAKPLPDTLASLSVEVSVIERPDTWQHDYVILCLVSGDSEICDDADDQFGFEPEPCRVDWNGKLGIFCDFHLPLPEGFLPDHIPEHGFELILRNQENTTTYYKISSDPFSRQCIFDFRNDNGVNRIYFGFTG